MSTRVRIEVSVRGAAIVSELLRMGGVGVRRQGDGEGRGHEVSSARRGEFAGPGSPERKATLSVENGPRTRAVVKGGSTCAIEVEPSRDASGRREMERVERSRVLASIVSPVSPYPLIILLFALWSFFALSAYLSCFLSRATLVSLSLALAAFVKLVRIQKSNRSPSAAKVKPALGSLS